MRPTIGVKATFRTTGAKVQRPDATRFAIVAAPVLHRHRRPSIEHGVQAGAVDRPAVDVEPVLPVIRNRALALIVAVDTGMERSRA